MYYNNQIVFDSDKMTPIKVGGGSSQFAWSNTPNNTEPFRITKLGSELGRVGSIYLPKTIPEAKKLIKLEHIQGEEIIFNAIDKIILRVRHVYFITCWKIGYWLVGKAENIKRVDINLW